MDWGLNFIPDVRYLKTLKTLHIGLTNMYIHENKELGDLGDHSFVYCTELNLAMIKPMKPILTHLMHSTDFETLRRRNFEILGFLRFLRFIT